MYDAIIIGARVAGSPLGMLLAQAGRNVLIVDRDTFPSDTLSTTYLQEDASVLLDRWGLLQRVYETGVPKATASLNFGNGMFTMTPEQRYPGISPRRTHFDKLLVDAAREGGAEVREGFSVQEIVKDENGWVTGIRGRGADGATVLEEARVVIGADGRNSFLARNVETEEYAIVEPTTCGYYSFFSGDPGTGAELHYNGRHAFFAFPTNDGLTCLASQAPFDAWQEYRSDPDSYLFGKMQQFAPTLHERAKEMKREETWYGMQGRRSYLRKPYGEGWILTGDAACLKDPVTGAGCNDALRDADLLAPELMGWLAGDSEWEAAMTRFHQKRDAAVMGPYQQAAFMAELHEVTPEFLGKLGQMMQQAPA